MDKFAARGCIEQLESRIAPAALHGQVLTYTDLDGDHVSLTISKGTLTASLFTFGTGSVDGTTSTPQELEKIALPDTSFTGADITVVVHRAPTGDGHVNIDTIDATGINLGKVIIPGDVTSMTCGSNNSATIPAAQEFSVYSMGAYGIGSSSTAFRSTFNGGVGSFIVKDDLRHEDVAIANHGGVPAVTVGSIFIGGSIIGLGAGAGFNVSGNIHAVKILGSILSVNDKNDSSGSLVAEGTIASVYVGGSIIGGPGNFSGALWAYNFGSITIRHDLLGGAGVSSGSIIASSDSIGSLTIGGSVIGGSGQQKTTINGNLIDGQISVVDNLGKVKIGGSLLGGAGEWGGKIESLGEIASVSIGGSLIGGPTDETGTIASDGGYIGSVTIGHNFMGGSVGASGTLADSGEIYSSGVLAKVTIGGDFSAGTSAGGTLAFSTAAIRAGNQIGTVKIGGSMLGNSARSVLILAGPPQILAVIAGQQPPPVPKNIAGLTVHGSVRNAEILAGFDLNENPADGDAFVGQVKVGGDWTASDLVAGAQDTGNDGWGIDDGVQTVANDPNIIAQIAGITIGGTIEGAAAIQNFGFVAQQINSFTLGGHSLGLHGGPSNDNFSIPLTTTVRVEEVN